jgi:predicted enzyme related to lactoylglutathione lyase
MAVTDQTDRCHKEAAAMNPQITAVVLGVEDLNRSRQFYAEGLGCPIDKDYPGFVSFELGSGSSSLGLYPREALAQAEQAGGKIVKPAEKAQWAATSATSAIRTATSGRSRRAPGSGTFGLT